MLDIVVSNLNQRSFIIVTLTELDQTVGLLQTRGTCNWIENLIQFYRQEKSKLKKKIISSIRKNPPRKRNIPGLSLKKPKFLKANSLNGGFVRKNIKSQSLKKQFQWCFKKVEKSTEQASSNLQKEKAYKKDERKSSHARNYYRKKSSNLKKKKSEKGKRIP